MAYPTMYKSINKTNVVKTLLDDYDNEKLKNTIPLARMRESEFIRQAVMEKVERFHARNSINMNHPQKDMNQLLESA